MHCDIEIDSYKSFNVTGVANRFAALSTPKPCFRNVSSSVLCNFIKESITDR